MTLATRLALAGNTAGASLIPPELIDAPVVLDLYQLAVDSTCFPFGLHMEFGVAAGRSLRKIRQLLPEEVELYGFDSFRGLPEPWNELPRGAFATHLRVDLFNTKLIVGTYEDTLEDFAKSHPESVSLMHIDCDLYSSTRTVLSAFKKQIVPGTVIIFDELFGFTGYAEHEYKALCESKLKYEVLGRWNAYRAVIRIEK